MNNFTFRPRLESLNVRLCLSVAGGAVLAMDVPRSGDEAGLIGLLRQGDEKDLVPAVEVVGAGDNTGDEKGLIGLNPGEKVGAAVDYRVGEMGWDVKPGDDRGLVPAVQFGDGGGERGIVAVELSADQLGGPFVGDTAKP